jgi:hypothetical protein
MSDLRKVVDAATELRKLGSVAMAETVEKLIADVRDLEAKMAETAAQIALDGRNTYRRSNGHLT